MRHEGIPLLIEAHRPHRLKPFTSYKFRVKATNDIGDSEFSEESEPLTTLQAGQWPPTQNSFSWPTCSSWALGILFGGEGPPKVGGAEGPLALCLALWAGPKEVWARGAFAMGLGPHTNPSILMCSFSAVPELVANPRKPGKRLVAGGSAAAASETCGCRTKRRRLWALGFRLGSELQAPSFHTCRRIYSLWPPRGPKPQPPELMCLSLSPAPDEAPTIVSVTPHTTTSVLIRWQVRPSSQQAGRGPCPRRTQTRSVWGPGRRQPPARLEHLTHTHRHASYSALQIILSGGRCSSPLQTRTQSSGK